MGLVPLEEETPESFLSCHMWTRGPVSTQQEGSCLQAKRRGLKMKSNLLAPESRTSQLQKCENQISVAEATQSLLVCYDSLSWLTQVY